MGVKGYKAFNLDKTNRYQRPFVEGETYRTEGLIKFGNDGNGFHMCKNLADVFRYFDSENVVVAEVEGKGNYDLYEDEYYGYYDMFASSEYKIIRVMSREEIVREVLTSKNIFRQKRLLERMRLTEEQLKLFKGLSEELDDVISYYQYHDTEVYQRKYKKTDF